MNVETLFTVTATYTPNRWGENITLSVLNPDGTVCVSHMWSCGPAGPCGADERDMVAWVSEATGEYLDTMFTAAAEQAEWTRRDPRGRVWPVV